MGVELRRVQDRKEDFVLSDPAFVHLFFSSSIEKAGVGPGARRAGKLLAMLLEKGGSEFLLSYH